MPGTLAQSAAAAQAQLVRANRRVQRGSVAFVEYRGEDPEVPIKPLHKMTEAQVKKEMTAQPLEFVETIRTLPRQHLIIFRKRVEKQVK